MKVKTSRSWRRRAAIGTAGVVCAVGALAPSAPAFMHTTGSAHVIVEWTQVHELQANGLPGRYLGRLFRNDNFRVDHAGSYWCRGHAYGNVHQDGLVPCENLDPGSR
jgi:hypothetical protein